MGQLLSVSGVRKRSVVKSNKERPKTIESSPKVVVVEYEKKEDNTLPSGYLIPNPKIRGRSSSDLFICPPTDNNNNYQSSIFAHKRHVIPTPTPTVDKTKQKSGSASILTGDAGLIKSSNNTYSNGGGGGGSGCNHHSSSNDTLLRTCQPQNNYLESSRSIYSEPVTVQSEPATRRYHHHHRHHQHHHNHRHHRRRRSKSTHNQHFGYDINNVDEFLSKCSLLSPGNIPVVLSRATTLYQTCRGFQKEVPVSLGMVVNAVFKIQQWVYVQTPHGEEGYLAYESCLPMGIIPAHKSSVLRSKPERCWETTEDIYRKPGTFTDSEKEYRIRATRSEAGGTRTPTCSEKNVDTLYLKAASQSKLDRTYSQVKPREMLQSNEAPVIKEKFTQLPSRFTPIIRRETLLAVQMNYKSSAISVQKGDVVTLLARKEIRDIHSRTPRQWFYIRTRSGSEAFIPSEVAGHGYL